MSNEKQQIGQDNTPKRITLRHLSGSRAQQVEEFPLGQLRELVIGRDPAAAVKYDAERDDLVSRRHAKIVQDPTDPTQFTIMDLGSRNGTYVNRQRIVDQVKLTPGDVIQFGPAGPEFQFDLEPRPEALMRMTRLAEAGPDVAALAATRIGPAPTEGPAAAPGVGKTTVMRMVAQIHTTARKQMIAAAAALVLLIGGVAGFSAYRNQRINQEITRQAAEAKAASAEARSAAVQEGKVALAAAAAAAPVTPAAIAKTMTNATVLIEMGWKLIHTPTGSQIYHEYIPVKDKKGKVQFIAAYMQMSDGSIEPSLTLQSGQANRSIGGNGASGTGFVITNDGFILTNRHVAAPWFTEYHFPPNALPGALFAMGQKGKEFKSIIQQPLRWVPAEAKAVGREPISGKLLEGRNDYLDVTFAKNELRMPAKLVRVSNRADVVMIKVDTPQSLSKAEMNDNYDSIRPGEGVTVMGYPGISPEVVVGTGSADPLGPKQRQFKVVPDPTITNGLIARVLRGEQAPTGREKSDYFSTMGDVYQLTINATGAGNSGGPVFDERGRVVGIYTYGRSDRGGTQISFAVPIRHGIELMGTNPVLR